MQKSRNHNAINKNKIPSRWCVGPLDPSNFHWKYFKSQQSTRRTRQLLPTVPIVSVEHKYYCYTEFYIIFFSFPKRISQDFVFSFQFSAKLEKIFLTCQDSYNSFCAALLFYYVNFSTKIFTKCFQQNKVC